MITMQAQTLTRFPQTRGNCSILAKFISVHMDFPLLVEVSELVDNVGMHFTETDVIPISGLF